MATKVIVIVSEKGGAGKTITAVSLPLPPNSAARATVIFDLDPRANSAVWGDARQGRPPKVIAAQVPRLPVLLQKARAQDADLVILDTPGNALPLAEAACPTQT